MKLSSLKPTRVQRAVRTRLSETLGEPMAPLPTALRIARVIGCVALYVAAAPSSANDAAPAVGSSSPPLYTARFDALTRAAAPPTAAQLALEARCKALVASGTPRSQMPDQCAPFLPPEPNPLLFNYSRAVAVYVAPTAAVGSIVGQGGRAPQPLSEARCRAALANGVPPSQLPPECAQYAPPPPSSDPRTPLCPDPRALTHVRLIPCPPAPNPGGSSRPPTNPGGNPNTTPGATDRRPTQPPTVSTPPTAPSPRPPAPNTTPPSVAPPAPNPPAPEPPVAVPPAPVPAPAPPPPFRGPASQLPTAVGGGAGVAPLSLPPPRVSSPAPAPAATANVDAQEFEPGEVLVFAPYAQNAIGALDVIRAAGGTVLTQTLLAELEGLLLRVRANDGDAPRLAQTLRQQLPQATVDLHTRLFLFPLAGAGGTGGAPRHYARAMLQLPSAPQPLKREVRVGIIDSGVERVGALRNGVADEKSFLPNEASPADSIHGTAVAAMIAGQDEGANFSGAAPGAKLYVARAMSLLPDGRSYTNAVSVLQALDWLLAQKVPIVNMSLGGKGDSTLAIGISQAIRKGLIVVAAAGNGGTGAAASFPAALPDVVAVTAIDVESKLYAQANRGDYVMVSAPGVDVWAPQRGGGSGAYVSGTSFSAAWVSGALAVVAGQSSTIDRSKWLSALCATAKDLGRAGRDQDYGCGLVQVADFAAKIR